MSIQKFDRPWVFFKHVSGGFSATPGGRICFMVEFVKGDMFAEADAEGTGIDVLVNTVNCVGVMGKGVALEFRKRYPLMHLAYQAACAVGDVRIGEMWVWHPILHEGRGAPWVINFPTKVDWRAPSEYLHIFRGLRALHEYLAHHPLITVAMPALGCGNGGLKWEFVRFLIRVELDDLVCKVLVFEPSA